MSRKVDGKLSFQGAEAVFLMGSRLWGTSRPDSDQDLLLIAEDPSLFRNQFGYDLIVKTPGDYAEAVLNGDIICIICRHLPSTHVLKGQAPSIPYTESALRQHLEYRRHRDCEYATKNWTKGKLDRAKKTMLHALITRDIARQLLSGVEIDWHIGIHYRDLVEEIDSLESFEALLDGISL